MDLFTGGATVAINLLANEIIAIDNNPKIINLLKFLKKQDYFKLINKIDKLIEKYGLSNSYKYGYSHYKEYVEGNNGLKKYNIEAFNKLKNDYNNLKNKYTDKANLYLYLLIVYAFNNYVEVHHLIPRAVGNDFENSIEVVENYVALCPHCHRLIHLGEDVERRPALHNLYIKRKDLLHEKGLDISEKELKEYYLFDS